MPDRPVTEADLLDKFLGLATPILGPLGARQLAHLVLQGSREPARALAAQTVPSSSVQRGAVDTAVR
jgi:hypothetical protein